MPSTQSTLKAIGSPEPQTWSAFIKRLPDAPVAFVERHEWRDLVNTIGALEAMELIAVVRCKDTNHIEFLCLTETGAELLRENEEQRVVVARRRGRVDEQGVWRHA